MRGKSQERDLKRARARELTGPKEFSVCVAVSLVYSECICMAWWCLHRCVCCFGQWCKCCQPWLACWGQVENAVILDIRASLSTPWKGPEMSANTAPSLPQAPSTRPCVLSQQGQMFSSVPYPLLLITPPCPIPRFLTVSFLFSLLLLWSFLSLWSLLTPPVLAWI